MTPMLKPHPNSPKGKAGRAETRRNRLASREAWADAKGSQQAYADRPARLERAGRQDTLFHPSKKRGPLLVAPTKAVAAPSKKGTMRPTFVRPAEGGGFEYGWVKVHKWTSSKDKSIVKGIAATYGEAITLSGRLA